MKLRECMECLQEIQNEILTNPGCHNEFAGLLQSSREICQILDAQGIVDNLFDPCYKDFDDAENVKAKALQNKDYLLELESRYCVAESESSEYAISIFKEITEEYFSEISNCCIVDSQNYENLIQHKIESMTREEKESFIEWFCDAIFTYHEEVSQFDNDVYKKLIEEPEHKQFIEDQRKQFEETEER